MFYVFCISPFPFLYVPIRHIHIIGDVFVLSTTQLHVLNSDVVAFGSKGLIHVKPNHCWLLWYPRFDCDYHLYGLYGLNTLEPQRKIKQLILLFGWTSSDHPAILMNNVGCIYILFIALAVFGPGLLCQWSAAAQTKKDFISLLRCASATGEVLPHVLYDSRYRHVPCWLAVALLHSWSIDICDGLSQQRCKDKFLAPKATQCSCQLLALLQVCQIEQAPGVHSQGE